MIRTYLLAPLILSGFVAATALSAAVVAGLAHVPPKRPALAVAAAVIFLLAGRRPAALWDCSSVRSWELLVGFRWIRVGLLTLGLIAALLAVFAPLPWLQVLPR